VQESREDSDNNTTTYTTKQSWESTLEDDSSFAANDPNWNNGGYSNPRSMVVDADEIALDTVRIGQCFLSKSQVSRLNDYVPYQPSG